MNISKSVEYFFLKLNIGNNYKINTTGDVLDSSRIRTVLEPNFCHLFRRCCGNTPQPWGFVKHKGIVGSG